MVAFAVRSWLLNNSDSNPTFTQQEQVAPQQRAITATSVQNSQASSENNLNSVVLASIRGVDISKKEETYIEELQFQLKNKKKSPVALSNQEFEVIAKKVTDKQTDSKKQIATINTYNKIHIPTQEQESLQNTVSQLVENSLKKTDSNEKQTEQKKLVKSLNNEADVRQNEMRTIVVRSGDTLSSISQRAYGDGALFHKIYRANPSIVNNPHRIYPGQILRVPL